MYMKCQLCSLHVVRFKVMQCIMIPISILCFSSLSLGTTKELQTLLQPIMFMLWHKEENMGVTQFSQDHLATCKQLGGAIILNLEIHLMARRFPLL